MNRHRVTTGGTDRDYLLATPEDPLALVVFLHGKGGTAAWADDETGWSRLAQREGFALALPEGRPPDPDRAPSFLHNPPRWADGSLTRDPDQNKYSDSTSFDAEDDDIAYLDAVIADARARAGRRVEKVFLSGFSNGAGMTFRYAAARADRLDGVAPVAGYSWLEHPHLARPLPTLYMVGTIDPLVPLRGGQVRSPWTHRLVQRPPVAETLERWAIALGCDPIPIPGLDSTNLNVQMDIYPGPVLFRSINIDGLGHHWPGGQGRLSPRLAGPPSNAVNATETVWEFFRALL